MDSNETIRFTCPKCHTHYRCKAAYAGRKTRCNAEGCGCEIVVPSASQVVEAGVGKPAGPPAPPSPPKRSTPPPRSEQKAAAAAPAPAVAENRVAPAAARADRTRQSVLQRHRWWFVGGGAALLGVVALVIFASGNSSEPESAQKAKPDPEKPANGRSPVVAQPVEELPSSTLSKRELRETLSDKLRLTGALANESVTEGFPPRTQTYRRWKSDLTLENHSAVSVGLGSDLFLFEIGDGGGSYNGYAVFGRKSSIASPESYGLGGNYEIEGNRTNHGGGMIRYSVGRAKPQDSLGTCLPSQPWTLKRDFPQFSWIRQESCSDVCLVLPELIVNTADGQKRFRLLAYFAKPQSGAKWTPREQQLFPVDLEELKTRLSSGGSNVITKVMAANWLAERFSKEAPAALTAAGRRHREGQLLATCLMLMNRLEAKGLEDHAANLLKDEKAPNGIRAMCARYLGAVDHTPALQALIATSGHKDRVVATASIAGLGRLGGPEAVNTLTKIFQDSSRSKQHRFAADALAATKDPAAIEFLKKRIAAKDEDALKALVAAEIPETFDYFVSLSKQDLEPKRLGDVARGLKASGGPKSLPVLLTLLSKAAPLPKGNSYGDALTRVLVELDLPAATSELTALARQGNLRAAIVLAESKNDSVEQPLIDLARNASAEVRRTAVRGLTRRDAAKHVDVFALAVQSTDTAVIQAGIAGIRESKTPRRSELLLPLLDHQDSGVRNAAANGIEKISGGSQLDRVANVLIATDDNSVVSDCVRLLIDAQWSDKSRIGQIGKKLEAAKSYERYDLVRLLRHLSGDAMGPKDSREWYSDSKGWCEKWVAWAKQQ